MRRIVIIAAGPSGVRAATRIKRRLPEHEVNLVVPAAIAAPQAGPDGPAARRRDKLLPNLEVLASREIGILEAQDIMPDLTRGEITVSSARGKLPIRYTDLVLEVPATVRLPRPLQKAENVFCWPMPEFAAETAPCDTALAIAASSGGFVLVVGSGAAALDAVCLALEAGAKVCWLRLKESGAPAVEAQLGGLIVRYFDSGVRIVDCPDLTADKLGFVFDPSGARLARVTLPDGREFDFSCVLWTTPLMGRHPVLREPGIELDSLGRIYVSENLSQDSCVVLMGSGSVVPGATLPGSGLVLPAWPGGDEAARYSAWAAIDAITGKTAPGAGSGVFAVREAGFCQPAPETGKTMRFFRAGLSLAESQALGRDADYAVVSSRGVAVGGSESLDQGAELVLCLTVDRVSRTLLGAQVLSLGPARDAADGLFALALAALAGGSNVEELARRSGTGLVSRLFSLAASILRNKLDTVIKGITPDEFLASYRAGAEFFTLDLRSLPDWRAGRVPGAYNIPLPQLKKRLQDEVPRFTPIVLVSGDGRDAYAVACRLASLGATDLYVLDGGMQLWPYEVEQGS